MPDIVSKAAIANNLYLMLSLHPAAVASNESRTRGQARPRQPTPSADFLDTSRTDLNAMHFLCWPEAQIRGRSADARARGFPDRIDSSFPGGAGVWFKSHPRPIRRHPGRAPSGARAGTQVSRRRG